MAMFSALLGIFIHNKLLHLLLRFQKQDCQRQHNLDIYDLGLFHLLARLQEQSTFQETKVIMKRPLK